MESMVFYTRRDSGEVAVVQRNPARSVSSTSHGARGRPRGATSTSTMQTTVIADVMDRGRVLSMSPLAGTTISGSSTPYWEKTGTAFIMGLCSHTFYGNTRYFYVYLTLAS